MPPPAQQTYMLDTDLFNDTLDGKMSATPFVGRRLLLTGAQASEVRNAFEQKRREKPFGIPTELKPAMSPSSSFDFGIEGAGWSEVELNDGGVGLDGMLARIERLDATLQRRKHDRRNKARDLFIAETAIMHGATLISRDARLRQVVIEFGGRAMDPCRF